MAKLSRLLAFLIVAVLLMFVLYHFYVADTQQSPQDTRSVFGRTMYSKSDAIGKLADPNYKMSFPQDHKSHDDFDIEWWYLTANLRGNDNNIYGLQWTLFRFRNPTVKPNSTSLNDSTWPNEQIFMAHASIHSMNNHWFSEKFARGGVGNAFVNSSPFTLRIDDWYWKNTKDSENLLPASLVFSANNTALSNSNIMANVTLEKMGPYILHGEDGFSVKSSTNHASHYYSAPFINISGMLYIEQENELAREVSVSGQAWFDQEWTSQLLDINTLGWDWFSLHLNNGSKVMAFRMRLRDQTDFITGSYINKEGQKTTLHAGDLNLKPISNSMVLGKDLPLEWRATIPSMNIDVVISSVKADQYNESTIPYYEGMVAVKGTHTGEGFIELSGY